MPEVWSFFTGAMGLDLGLEQAGIQTTLAVELDPACCDTIRKNRADLTLLQQDVRNLAVPDLVAARAGASDVLLMVGGPPCQSFSPGGKRAALSDPRGNLVYTYLKLISEIRPRCFVFENVANIVTAALRHRQIADRPGQHWNLKTYGERRVRGTNGEEPMSPDELSGSAIRQVFTDMSRLGYHLRFAVLDAADFGAAQHRLRFVMVGSRDGTAPLLPTPTCGDNCVGLPPFKTVRNAIYDLRENPGPHSKYTPAVARFFELVPPGGTWRNLPKDLQRCALGGAFDAGGGKTGFFRRLSWDSPAPTITGRSNRKASALCHPEFTRPVSVRECARLQGFPDDWTFAGAMNQQYLQVGNAVPIALGAAIGRAVLSGEGAGAERSEQTLFDLEFALKSALARLHASARNKRSRSTQPTLF